MNQSTILEGMIGLEIHTYLVTKEKLFCKCFASRQRGLKANTNICPICTGQPGAKPYLPNDNALKQAIRLGLMLGCKISPNLHWQRKHYDWPDLPKGFQTTLSGPASIPLGVNGYFEGIKISSMHLEEDPASWEPDTGKVDFNRSGLPLVEIVTAPDFKNAEQVINWLNLFLHHVSYLKAVDTNAGIKVDVNISIPGISKRVEVKNINSLESISRAIEYELKRQNKEGGENQETRRFDELSGKTSVMRTKEEADDYRFIIDPDLQEIYFEEDFVSNLAKSLPESPSIKLDRLVKQHKLDSTTAKVLIKHLDLAEFFEEIVLKIDAKFAAPWVTIELLRFLNYHKKQLNEVSIQPEHFIALLMLVRDKKITELQGKKLLNEFYPKSFLPKAVPAKINDEEELKSIAKLVLEEFPQAVLDFKAGEQKAVDFLMGKIMEKTQRRADFQIARKVILSILNG